VMRPSAVEVRPGPAQVGQTGDGFPA